MAFYRDLSDDGSDRDDLFNNYLNADGLNRKISTNFEDPFNRQFQINPDTIRDPYAVENNHRFNNDQNINFL